jgi:hypothetical protein
LIESVANFLRLVGNKVYLNDLISLISQNGRKKCGRISLYACFYVVGCSFASGKLYSLQLIHSSQIALLLCTDKPKKRKIRKVGKSAESIPSTATDAQSAPEDDAKTGGTRSKSERKVIIYSTRESLLEHQDRTREP